MIQAKSPIPAWDRTLRVALVLTLLPWQSFAGVAASPTPMPAPSLDTSLPDTALGGRLAALQRRILALEQGTDSMEKIQAALQELESLKKDLADSGLGESERQILFNRLGALEAVYRARLAAREECSAPQPAGGFSVEQKLESGARCLAALSQRLLDSEIDGPQADFASWLGLLQNARRELTRSYDEHSSELGAEKRADLRERLKYLELVLDTVELIKQADSGQAYNVAMLKELRRGMGKAARLSKPGQSDALKALNKDMAEIRDARQQGTDAFQISAIFDRMRKRLGLADELVQAQEAAIRMPAQTASSSDVPSTYPKPTREIAPSGSVPFKKGSAAEALLNAGSSVGLADAARTGVARALGIVFSDGSIERENGRRMFEKDRGARLRQQEDWARAALREMRMFGKVKGAVDIDDLSLAQADALLVSLSGTLGLRGSWPQGGGEDFARQAQDFLQKLNQTDALGRLKYPDLLRYFYGRYQYMSKVAQAGQQGLLRSGAVFKPWELGMESAAPAGPKNARLASIEYQEVLDNGTVFTGLRRLFEDGSWQFEGSAAQGQDSSDHLRASWSQDAKHTAKGTLSQVRMNADQAVVTEYAVHPGVNGPDMRKIREQIERFKDQSTQIAAFDETTGASQWTVYGVFELGKGAEGERKFTVQREVHKDGTVLERTGKHLSKIIKDGKSNYIVSAEDLHRTGVAEEIIEVLAAAQGYADNKDAKKEDAQALSHWLSRAKRGGRLLFDESGRFDLIYALKDGSQEIIGGKLGNATTLPGDIRLERAMLLHDPYRIDGKGQTIGKSDPRYLTEYLANGQTQKWTISVDSKEEGWGPWRKTNQYLVRTLTRFDGERVLRSEKIGDNVLVEEGSSWFGGAAKWVGDLPVLKQALETGSNVSSLAMDVTVMRAQDRVGDVFNIVGLTGWGTEYKLNSRANRAQILNDVEALGHGVGLRIDLSEAKKRQVNGFSALEKAVAAEGREKQARESLAKLGYDRYTLGDEYAGYVRRAEGEMGSLGLFEGLVGQRAFGTEAAQLFANKEGFWSKGFWSGALDGLVKTSRSSGANPVMYLAAVKMPGAAVGEASTGWGATVLTSVQKALAVPLTLQFGASFADKIGQAVIDWKNDRLSDALYHLGQAVPDGIFAGFMAWDLGKWGWSKMGGLGRRAVLEPSLAPKPRPTSSTPEPAPAARPADFSAPAEIGPRTSKITPEVSPAGTPAARASAVEPRAKAADAPGRSNDPGSVGRGEVKFERARRVVDNAGDMAAKGMGKVADSAGQPANGTNFFKGDSARSKADSPAAARPKSDTVAEIEGRVQEKSARGSNQDGASDSPDFSLGGEVKSGPPEFLNLKNAGKDGAARYEGKPAKAETSEGGRGNGQDGQGGGGGDNFNGGNGGGGDGGSGGDGGPPGDIGPAQTQAAPVPASRFLKNAAKIKDFLSMRWKPKHWAAKIAYLPMWVPYMAFMYGFRPMVWWPIKNIFGPPLKLAWHMGRPAAEPILGIAARLTSAVGRKIDGVRGLKRIGEWMGKRFEEHLKERYARDAADLDATFRKLYGHEEAAGLHDRLTAMQEAMAHARGWRKSLAGLRIRVLKMRIRWNERAMKTRRAREEKSLQRAKDHGISEEALKAAKKKRVDKERAKPKWSKRAGRWTKEMLASALLWLPWAAERWFNVARKREPVNDPRGELNNGNKPPEVKAGEDQTVQMPEGKDSFVTVTLNGTVTDDGKPNGRVDAFWKNVGPIPAKLEQAETSLEAPEGKPVPVTASVTFFQEGQYTLMLKAVDGGNLTASSEVKITVEIDRQKKSSPEQSPGPGSGSGAPSDSGAPSGGGGGKPPAGGAPMGGAPPPAAPPGGGGGGGGAPGGGGPGGAGGGGPATANAPQRVQASGAPVLVQPPLIIGGYTPMTVDAPRPSFPRNPAGGPGRDRSVSPNEGHPGFSSPGENRPPASGGSSGGGGSSSIPDMGPFNPSRPAPGRRPKTIPHRPVRPAPAPMLRDSVASNAPRAEQKPDDSLMKTFLRPAQEVRSGPGTNKDEPAQNNKDWLYFLLQLAALGSAIWLFRYSQLAQLLGLAPGKRREKS